MNNIYGNDSCIEIISQAIDNMKAEQGDSFSIENINLVELSRRDGINGNEDSCSEPDNWKARAYYERKKVNQ